MYAMLDDDKNKLIPFLSFLNFILNCFDKNVIIIVAHSFISIDIVPGEVINLTIIYDYSRIRHCQSDPWVLNELR